jgi:hypothetical protein
MLMEVYTGMAVRIVLIRINLPLWCISLPFQVGNLFATLLTRSWRAALCSLVTERGMPMYIIGNSTTCKGNMDAAS